MARQVLGPKKLRKCCSITGKQYTQALVRGGSGHFWAICWYTDRDADWVNYETGEWEPYTRDGRLSSASTKDLDEEDITTGGQEGF